MKRQIFRKLNISYFSSKYNICDKFKAFDNAKRKNCLPNGACCAIIMLPKRAAGVFEIRPLCRKFAKRVAVARVCVKTGKKINAENNSVSNYKLAYAA